MTGCPVTRDPNRYQGKADAAVDYDDACERLCAEIRKGVVDCELIDHLRSVGQLDDLIYEAAKHKLDNSVPDWDDAPW